MGLLVLVVHQALKAALGRRVLQGLLVLVAPRDHLDRQVRRGLLGQVDQAVLAAQLVQQALLGQE